MEATPPAATKEDLAKAERMLLDAAATDRKILASVEKRVTALEPKPYDKRRREGHCAVVGCPEVGTRFVDAHPEPWLLLRWHLCEPHDEQRKAEKGNMQFDWQAADCHYVPGAQADPGLSLEERFDELKNQTAGATSLAFQQILDLEKMLATRLAVLERDALGRGVKLGEV